MQYCMYACVRTHISTHIHTTHTHTHAHTHTHIYMIVIVRLNLHSRIFFKQTLTDYMMKNALILKCYFFLKTHRAQKKTFKRVFPSGTHFSAESTEAMPAKSIAQGHNVSINRLLFHATSKPNCRIIFLYIHCIEHIYFQ